MSNSKMRVWLWAYAPFLIWTGVIFFLSSNLGSSTHTSLIVEPLLKFFFPDISKASIEFAHACVRKTAHFTEYGILALLGIRAFSAATGMLLRFRWVLSILIVAAVASLDEFNQSFEASRTSSVWDVMLDILGGVFASLAWYAAWRLRSRNS